MSTETGWLEQEPPTGSVVAISWRGHHPEVWVSNHSNTGCWYCPDIPMRGDEHPHWEDVLRRARGRTLTLLVAADRDTYRTGYLAGADAVQSAITAAMEEASWLPEQGCTTDD